MQKIQRLISEHINTWITAELDKKSGRGRSSVSSLKVYGVQKLRELILDLAISGKLIVEKDTDNLEINFLKNIEKEINKLTKKGLLAKRKPLTPIRENEKFFKLPQSWEWIRLGKTGKIFNGNSINENEKRTKYTNIKDGRPFIATKDVGYGREKLNYKNGILIPHDESRFKMAHKNAVLICSEGGSAGKKIGITEHDIFFGNKLFANETFSGINPRYIFYVYQSQSFYKSFFKRMTGIIGGIPVKEFLNIPIPIPPTKQQNELVRKIDELMMLCDQLEKKHINSREAHVKLVKVLLNTLIQAKDAKEFKNSWQCIANHFDTLFTSKESLDELKQTILKVAVMGRLVPQDPNDETADELLKKIQAEKIKLINKKKQSQDKIVQHIHGNQTLCKFPKNWLLLRLKDSYQSISPNGKQLKTSEIKTTGKFPVVDQGQSYIAGYTDLDECLIKIPHPVIVFGDHTRNIKFIDFNFAAGADGTKILAPILINPRFFYYYLLSYKLESKGYARHFSILNKNFIAIPPLTEQHRIVTQLDDLIILCDELKSLIHQSSIKQNHIADVLVSKVLNSKEV